MKAALPLGRMRHRLTIEAPVDTTDDNGGVARSFVDAGALWAAIETIGRRRQFLAERPEQSITHHVLFRRREGLTGDFVLRKGARRFRVLAIEDLDTAGRAQRALCEEIKP